MDRMEFPFLLSNAVSVLVTDGKHNSWVGAARTSLQVPLFGGRSTVGLASS